jgi:hypothetical protein
MLNWLNLTGLFQICSINCRYPWSCASVNLNTNSLSPRMLINSSSLLHSHPKGLLRPLMMIRMMIPGLVLLSWGRTSQTTPATFKALTTLFHTIQPTSTHQHQEAASAASSHLGIALSLLETFQSFIEASETSGDCIYRSRHWGFYMLMTCCTCNVLARVYQVLQQCDLQ